MSTFKTVAFKLKLDNSLVMMLALSLIWLILNGVSLMQYPSVAADESLVGLVAYRDTLAAQVQPVSTFDPFGAYPFRFYLMGLTQWFNVFGAGLVQARTFSLAGAYVAGWLMFGLGKSLFNKQVGVLGAALLWFNTHVFWTSHFVRPEIWVMAANIGGLLAGWWLIKNPAPWRAVVVGFISVMILNVYLSSISTTLIVSGLVLVWTIWQRQWKLLGAFGAGTVIGGIGYLAVQLLPDIPGSIAKWQQWLIHADRIGTEANAGWATRLNIGAILFEQYVRYSVIGWLEFAYFVVSAVWLIRRRMAEDSYILLGALVAFIIFAVLFAAYYHTTDGIPLPVLIIAAGLADISEDIRQRFTNTLPTWLSDPRLLALLAAPLMAAYIALSLYYWQANKDYDYLAYVGELQALTTREDSIVGDGIWWWGFMNQPYWWDGDLEKIYLDSPVDSTEVIHNLLQREDATVVFVDENLGSMPLPGQNELMLQALTNYLDDHCDLRGSVAQVGYGIDFGGPIVKETRVYRCKPE
jgi:hypothetical protein